MKKRIVLAIAALLPLAIAFAATQGDAPAAKAALAPTEAQAQAGTLMYLHLSGSDFSYRPLPLDD
ncbi:MAG: hypothetical protein ACOVKN_06720, partial [Arenimonas sp.]